MATLLPLAMYHNATTIPGALNPQTALDMDFQQAQMACGGDAIPQAPTAQWPANYAKAMSREIHKQVCGMLSQSRLMRNSNDVKLVQRSDIVLTHEILGQGAFSQVSSITASDGLRYACKHLKQELMDRPEDFRLAATELACEAHMLASFDHPNILTIRGWARNGVTSYEEGYHDSFFLLLDQLDETLDQRIVRWQAEEQQQKNQFQLGASMSMFGCPPNVSVPSHHCPWRRYTTAISTPAAFLGSSLPQQPSQSQPIVDITHENLYSEKLRIMADIASALAYLHERGVVFRDAKPNNIGFLNGRQVQLFDFGLSRELPSLDTSIPFEMSGKVGTLRYMAPEVSRHQPYNVAADVYSWAMVCYEMLSYEKPFVGWTREMHASYVCDRGMRPDLINCGGTVPQEMQMLLGLAWGADPFSRPAIGELGEQVQFLRKQHQMLLFNEDQQQQEQQRQQQQQMQEQQQQQMQIQRQQEQQQQLQMQRQQEQQQQQMQLQRQQEQQQQQMQLQRQQEHIWQEELILAHQIEQQRMQQRHFFCQMPQQNHPEVTAFPGALAPIPMLSQGILPDITFAEKRTLPKLLDRSGSIDSIGTIETSSLSADSDED